LMPLLLSSDQNWHPIELTGNFWQI